MTKILSLFGSQEEATTAVERLAALDFYDELDTEVIDSFAADSERDTTVFVPIAAPAIAPEGRQFMGPATPIWPIAGLELDSETSAFFDRGLRNGGVLVVVEGNDRYAEPVRQLLREAGGRTSRE
jgi:hypothetical protein